MNLFLCLVLCAVAVTSQNLSDSQQPESRTSVHCNQEGKLFLNLFIQAKTFTATAPPGQIITCIECKANGKTFDVASGGLDQNEVTLNLYKPCSLKVWGNRGPVPPPQTEDCSEKGNVLHEAQVYPGTVKNHTVSPETISCLECKDRRGDLKSLKVLSGGVGEHSISVLFYDDCYYKVYVNGASINTISIFIGLLSPLVYLLVKY